MNQTSVNLHREPASLKDGVMRRVLRAGLLVSFVVVAGAVLLMRHQSDRAQVASAQRVAAATAAGIELGPGGDFEASARRITDRNPHILTIGSVSVSGMLGPVFPNLTHRREALSAALSDANELGSGVYDAALPGRDAEAWSQTPRARVMAVVVPIHPSDPLRSQQLALLVATAPDPFATTAMFLLLGLGLTVSLFSATSVRRWLDRRVVRPMRSLADAVVDARTPAEWIPVLDLGEWRETSRLANQMETLIRAAAQSDAQRRRLERESKKRLEETEAGFHRRLRRAKDLATTDPLTGMRNRTFLTERLPALFENAIETGDELSAVMIDLDNFKSHNDTHGHDAGDALLRFVGSLVCGAIRPTDFAIRYGGDEFLLLLPGTAEHEALHVAERIVKLFGQYAKRLDRSKGLSMSAGVASTKSGKCTSADDLVILADKALYSIKRSGKNAAALAGAA